MAANKDGWSPWRAAFYGLIIAAITIVAELKSGGGELSTWLHTEPATIGYVGRLIIIPLFLVLMTFIRNRQNRRANLSPSRPTSGSMRH